MKVNLDEADNIRTERQAEGASAGVQAQAVSLRSSGFGVTESNLTTGTRATKATTSGSLADDEFFETDTLWRYRWAGTSWAYTTGLYMATNVTRLALSISSADNGALFFATDTLILWQVSSGSWVKRLEIKGTANQILASISSGVLTLSLIPATGWTAATGTATRSTFDTATVTLEELARRVKALIDDGLTHGSLAA